LALPDSSFPGRCLDELGAPTMVWGVFWLELGAELEDSEELM